MNVKFVSESVIDEVIEASSSEAGFDQVQLEILGEEEPMLLAYLTGEQFDLLTNEEKRFFLLLGLDYLSSNVKSNT
ncbi:MAG: hypothetical protein HC892_00785 [Saprospiraceae bacterium]|nr:hypothetical protein [Saprospiraceae bacterium]